MFPSTTNHNKQTSNERFPITTFRLKTYEVAIAELRKAFGIL
ncbi:2026_t:CDS:2 [Ambispora leptoticha]|uniref:2026_t:CDS:1 n=1 Tax=Ambispora leptoticha TaxID=144679 RepID=A0A9N9C490_9GLOM|nr:2026_t:CDS:2 [Ambispora leptoticha]